MEKKYSPKPPGYEDVPNHCYIEVTRNGVPATWHNFHYYVRRSAPKTESWARRMNT